MNPLTALLSLLLLLVPAASANHDFEGGYYGSDLGRGRSYESYSRSYDTSKSDIASHTVSRSGSGTDSGYPNYGGSYGGYGDGGYNLYGGYGPGYGSGNWYQYMPYNHYSIDSYQGGNYQGYIPPYYPTPISSRSYSDTFTDNYNRQYNERTNENIKVDRYSRYDDLGLVYRVAGDYYGGSRPYFISYDSTNDPYANRYPYAGSTSGDRGYFAQPYYSTARIEPPAPTRPQALIRYAERSPISRPTGKDARLEQGPSQGYINTITDRGPLYAPLKPLASQFTSQPQTALPPEQFSKKEMESGAVIRNPQDRSVYNGEPERDSSYVQPYGTGRKP